jgi:hypothetical protein
VRVTRRLIAQAGLAAWLICLATAFWAVKDGGVPDMIKGVAFAAIPLAIPFFILWIAAFIMRSRSGLLVLLAGVAMELAWWLYAFLSTFVFADRIDAQSGLVFIIGPLYGVIGAILLAVIAFIVDRLLPR